MTYLQKVTAVRLVSVHYQHPNLEGAGQFLKDFGLTEISREDNLIYFGGFGPDPYVYVAEQASGPKRAFLGGTWAVESAKDLDLAAAHPDASGVQEAAGPGGGIKVTLTDPNGFPITFIYGQTLKATARAQETTRMADNEDPVINLATQKQRQGRFRRFTTGPSPVYKLGHYGYYVPRDKYDQTKEWYTNLMNIVPTDSIYSPETEKETICFMHLDLGKTYTDHHSFFLGASPTAKKAFVHHSSFEVNDMDTEAMGHQWLTDKGYTNCWGIGRHVLGSQIFDYWFDPSGNIVEHYSDGDLVNELTPFTSEPEAPDSIHIWGPSLPLSFITGSAVAD
ncbi:Metapyrocatechase 2 [Fusarium oxysporum f. sp. rapae]|uniref:Metapyrocatechase 2 n=1 Tax=Fusarium oxysporum f. sp. rapae TaxID=485398 RepID=A0A8J5U137_FUSOX|nr:Metapyrocatechase 2 [Fusarium oxysporum f. sp. rapae]